MPVTEPFAQRSPYALHRDDGALLRSAATARTWRRCSSRRGRPGTTRRTATGKPMTRIGTLQGTYLGIYQAKVCEYWTGEADEGQLQVLLGRPEPGRRRRGREVGRRGAWRSCARARDESGITYVDFNTGHYDGDTYLDILEPYIRRIKKELGLLVGVQTPPHRDLRALRRAARDGRQPRLVLLRDLRPRRSSRSLPRQARGVRARPLPRGRPLLRGARQQGPAPRAVGHERRDHRRASSRPSRRSARSTGSRRSARSRRSASSARWSAPTCRTRRRRSTEDLVPGLPRGSTRRAWSAACRSAARPNVHVSLVLLPEECASLSTRRYPWQRAKLALMRRVMAARFRNRMAA